jgi:hypothetical protein
MDAITEPPKRGKNEPPVEEPKNNPFKKVLQSGQGPKSRRKRA